MSKKLQAEARLALQIAINVLDKYFSAGEHPITEETIITGNVLDELPVPTDLPHYDHLKGWTFTYNATYIPSCCAGDCHDCQPQAVGHLDINTPLDNTTPSRTYSFSLETLLRIEWDI